MRQVITTERIPIKLWLYDLEDSALQQAKNVANLPFAFKHVAIMPDSHTGVGCGIGTVCATKGVVVPSMVGVDISCGLIACKTNKLASEIEVDTLKSIMGIIRSVIPFGLNKKHPAPQPIVFMPPLLSEAITPIVSKEYEKARYSIGSGGSGNHFLELQKDHEGFLWIMIHSGSRNLGLTVANHYIKIATALNEKWHSSVKKELRLAFLPLDSDEAHLYLNEMSYCVDYALANRKLMMERTCNIVESFFDGITFDPYININHNYSKMEHWYGENVMVHRKGATSAKVGEIGIIPGSQGSHSYIVCGKGNPESFNSVSHGAGRTMSRTRAKAELNLADEIKTLDDQGIIHGIRNTKDLEEAVSAYKSIGIVMDNQKDLVDIVTELTPIGCIKG